MSVIALQTVEEYRQVPVAEEVDVALVVSNTAVFAGSATMLPDLVIIWGNGLEQIEQNSSCSVKFILLSWRYHHICVFCISLMHS